MNVIADVLKLGNGDTQSCAEVTPPNLSCERHGAR